MTILYACIRLIISSAKYTRHLGITMSLKKMYKHMDKGIPYQQREQT